jgi:hypothetical protein
MWNMKLRDRNERNGYANGKKRKWKPNANAKQMLCSEQ